MLRFAQSYDRQFTMPIIIGNKRFDCWHANTYASRNLGLMGHTLTAGTGCLLDFGRATEVGLWMKNCLHPLTAVFANDDGRIIAKTLMPVDNPNYIHKAPQWCRFALEVLPEEAEEIAVGDYLEALV